VRKPRSEGLRRSNGAQATVPVPLKPAASHAIVFFSRGTACRARRKNLAGSRHLSRCSSRFQKVKKAFVARALLDGADVLVARSGTACRAPTAGNGDCKRTTQALSRLRNSSAVATWGTVRNDCATEAFGIGRKLSPGLKVQVMFQTRTCTFAPAVENYAPTARQMLYLRGTVENGTGRC
jgi:hypothetical protein